MKDLKVGLATRIFHVADMLFDDRCRGLLQHGIRTIAISAQMWDNPAESTGHGVVNHVVLLVAVGAVCILVANGLHLILADTKGGVRDSLVEAILPLGFDLLVLVMVIESACSKESKKLKRFNKLA